MKFSTIAGVAAFVAGAFAAPQAAADKALAAPVSKRVDLSSIISELTGDVADVVSQANTLSAKVKVASSLGDVSLVANLTSDLITLNVSLSGVVDLLKELGLGSVASTAGGAGSAAEGVVGGLLGVVSGAVSTVLGTAGGLLSGLTGGLSGVTGGVTSAATGADSTGTTAVTSALGGITNASGLASILGGLLTAVGDLLGSLTNNISTGSLGDVSSLTNLNSITGSLTGGSGSDPVAIVEGTLEGLVVAVVSVLGNLLGGI